MWWMYVWPILVSSLAFISHHLPHTLVGFWCLVSNTYGVPQTNDPNWNKIHIVLVKESITYLVICVNHKKSVWTTNAQHSSPYTDMTEFNLNSLHHITTIHFDKHHNTIKQLHDCLFPKKEATIRKNYESIVVCCKFHNT
jgi:hypothetical protein